MPKTYTAVPSVSTGDVYTAANYNTYTATNVSNLIVPPMVRARREAVQSIANASWTCITFDKSDYDTDGMFTASSTIITAQTTGVFQINAGVVFAANATGLRGLSILKNPTVAGSGDAVTVASPDSVMLSNVQVPPVSGSSTSIVGATSAALTAGDVIRVIVYQASGGALNIGDATRTLATYCSLTWIGRTS